jgi:hypothetical protein
LTAETVIMGLEDAEDYKAFELSVTSDFDAQTAIERELVLRLASLLWRLRRAAAIETGLLQIQNEIPREARHAQVIQPQHHDRGLDAIPFVGGDRADGRWGGQGDVGRSEESRQTINAGVGRCFLRLANLDNGAFERLSRYETALWRQVGQVLITLDMLRRTR